MAEEERPKPERLEFDPEIHIAASCLSKDQRSLVHTCAFLVYFGGWFKKLENYNTLTLDRFTELIH